MKMLGIFTKDLEVWAMRAFQSWYPTIKEWLTLGTLAKLVPQIQLRDYLQHSIPQG